MWEDILIAALVGAGVIYLVYPTEEAEEPRGLEPHAQGPCPVPPPELQRS